MKYISIFFLVIGFQAINAQRYLSKNAFIKFYSFTPLEKIEAVNNTGACILDASTGNIEFSALNTAFQFKKALMQQHFNENYMESSKFPKSKFKGKIEDMSKINFIKAGTYSVNIVGDLNMHGVSKNLSIPATLVINEKGIITSEVKFKIKAEDYKIEIPNLVKDNIAKELEITVKGELNKM